MSNNTKSDRKQNVTIISFEADERFGEDALISMKFRQEELKKMAEAQEGSRFLLRKGKLKDGSPLLGKFSGTQVYFLEILPPYNKPANEDL